MDLNEALKVLNERRHRGSSHWSRVRGLRLRRGEMVKSSDDSPSPAWLEAFEAVAIAEKYLRAERRGASEDQSVPVVVTP